MNNVAIHTAFPQKCRNVMITFDGGNGSHANSHLLRALSQVPGCPSLLLPASATPVPDEEEANSILSVSFSRLHIALVQKTFQDHNRGSVCA